MSASVLPQFGRRNGDPLPLIVPAPEVSIETGPSAQAINEIRTLCLSRLEPGAVAGMSSERLTGDMERLISEIATQNRIQLNAREQRGLATELVHDIVGLGPLEPLLADDTISDIMVNGPDRVFVERRGKTVRSTVRFRDTQHLAGICQRIAAAVGRRVDESSPMVDARLKDGSRVNIVFQPLALDGPYVSIRKFGKKPIDLAKLVEFGALTPTVAKALEIAARCRLNIIISGGTGSGKTTMMNALSRFIAPGRTGSDGRGRRRVAVATTACGTAGDETEQPGGQGRGQPARTGPQRPADASRSDHHRRGARRRGVRHVAGDEHRP